MGIIVDLGSGVKGKVARQGTKDSGRKAGRRRRSPPDEPAKQTAGKQRVNVERIADRKGNQKVKGKRQNDHAKIKKVGSGSVASGWSLVLRKRKQIPPKERRAGRGTGNQYVGIPPIMMAGKQERRVSGGIGPQRVAYS